MGTHLTIFRLLENQKNTVSVYRGNENGEKLSENEYPAHYAVALSKTVIDKDGNLHLIRYKETCKTVFVAEQAKPPYNIDPKDFSFKFTERNSRYFKDGYLYSRNEALTNYLKTLPECKGSEYTGQYGEKPVYEVYEQKNENVKSVKYAFKQGDAISKIRNSSIEELHELIFKIKGSNYPVTDDKDETSLILLNLMNESDENIDLILQEENNSNQKEKILIGKLIHAKIIDFNLEPDWVVRITKDKKEQKIKQISSSHAHETREQMFIEYLSTSDGKLVLESCEKQLSLLKVEDKKKN